MPMKGLFENMISFWDCLLGHHKVGLAIFCVLEKEGGGRICSVYRTSPAVIDQKYSELFTFMIKA